MRKRVPGVGDEDFTAVQKIINKFAKTRQQLGYSQSDIGIVSGYSQSGISELEAMKVPLVSLITLVRYARAMELELVVVFVPTKEHTDAAEAWKKNPR